MAEQAKLDLPSAEQVAVEIKAALTTELAHAAEKDVLAQVDPAEAAKWVAEDVAAVLAEIAEGKH